MGISSAMAAGVMGLSANSSKLAAISDNIANSETKGYKRANVDFTSLVTDDRPTSYDAGGVRASTVRYVDAQGSLASTTNATDLAISGRGFLPVADITDVNRSLNPPLKLARTGSFAPDANGLYRTAGGLALLGWKADANGVFPSQRADLEPVKIDNLTLAAEPTTQIDVSLNLDAGTNPGDPPFTIPLDFYDAIGSIDTLDISFSRPPAAAANTWRMEVEQRSNPGVSLASFDVTFYDSLGAEPGKIASVAGGPGTWDATTGDLDITTTTGSLQLGLGAWGPAGAANGPTGVTQFASRSELRGATSDGAPASSVVGVEVGENGVLDAIFDTGFRQSLFKIPLASVQNPNAMRALDGSSYELTRDSGNVFFFEAGTGPTGRLVSNALEESTTDVAEELTQLIKTQRAYSSNAKIIQTVDEMLQETTNLKR